MNTDGENDKVVIIFTQHARSHVYFCILPKMYAYSMYVFLYSAFTTAVLSSFHFLGWSSLIPPCYYFLNMQLFTFPSIKCHLKKIICSSCFLRKRQKQVRSSRDGAAACHYSSCYHSGYIEVEE